MKSPLDILLPYQRKWVDDASRFKIGMWARQTGKSFSSAPEAVVDGHLNKQVDWLILSRGERQSLEWLAKAKKWAEAFDIAIDGYIEQRDGPETLIKSAEIILPNKSRIIALPANPDTCRGYSANVILDEFAIHEKPTEIWNAIFPSITNPLTGLKKLRVLSTPNGRGNKFYQLWTSDNAYSKHKITIHDAIKWGLLLDAEELRKAIDDPDAWAQEYLCEFIDAASILLPYDMIATCETELQPTDFTRRYLGIDIGRKNDLTVIWELCQIGDVLWTASVDVMRNTEYYLQYEAIAARLADPSVKRCAIDSTGIGDMLAEELHRKFGSRVLQCHFTAELKGEIFTGLRRRMEERTLRIPVSRDVREDLHAMEKTVTSSGTVRYAAPRSADGHSDRAAALALAVHAAKDDISAPIEISKPRDRFPFPNYFGGRYSGASTMGRI